MSDETNISAISSTKTTYRGYVKLGTVTEGDTTKTVVTERRVSQETDAKDAETGLPRAWAQAEKDGLVLYNENTVTSYEIKALDGFEALNPDADTRLYIINLGLSNFQNMKAQSFMKANVENAAEPTPQYNQVDLDLRVGLGDEGEYSIQSAPQRRATSVEDKIRNMLLKSGKTPEEVEAILYSIAASMASA